MARRWASVLGVAALTAAALFWMAQPAQARPWGGRGWGGGWSGGYYGGYGGYGWGGWGGYNDGYRGYGWGGYPYYGGRGYGEGYYSAWPGTYNYGYSPGYTGTYVPEYYSSGVPASGAYASYYQPDTAAAGYTGDTTVSDTSVLLSVRVPADAEVWVDGQRTTQRGTLRQYESSDLTAGRDYTYVIRARWDEDGRPVDRTRRVTVRAGERQTVDFMRTGARDEEAAPAPVRDTDRDRTPATDKATDRDRTKAADKDRNNDKNRKKSSDSDNPIP
jgi:uncharacterized protein (TIGR03000 family)